MEPRLPFRRLRPVFCAGLLEDPVLYLQMRPAGRALLVDCGQLQHLAKRVLKSVSTLFISHAHMDHFMGFDTFVRTVHVAPRTCEVHGPPGLAGKLAHKLAAYDWNLAERGWCTFRVREVHADRIETFLLPGPEGFPCRRAGSEPRRTAEIWRNRQVTVASDLCDHKIPSLAFRFDERPSFAVDREKLEEAGLVAGDWLGELERRFRRDALGREPLTVLRRRGEAVAAEAADDRALYAAVARNRPPAGVGYLTDLGFSAENRARARALLRGVTLLVAECTYLRGEEAKARASCHLCSDDVNRLLDELRPAWFLPVHLSKAYLGRSGRLYEELEMPPGTTLLRLPERLAPRPLLPAEAAAAVTAVTPRRGAR